MKGKCATSRPETNSKYRKKVIPNRNVLSGVKRKETGQQIVLHKYFVRLNILH